MALSTGINDSGLFQVNYSDERFLPFEGTGAASTWRLEVNGVDGPLHRQTLSDVIMTVQYTARSGGSSFAEAAKSLLGKTSNERAWLVNLAADYSDAWQAFMNNPAAGIAFTVDRNSLPGASTNAVSGVFLYYELTSEPEEDLSRQALKLSPSPDNQQLKPNSFLSGLTLPLHTPGQDPANATWRLTPPTSSTAAKFNPRNVRTISLVVVYDGKTRF
ncbi:MAG TPA: hypothetical protein VI299_03455 [Polyangiales bacterium]